MSTADPAALFAKRHASYARFIRLVRYREGIRSLFMHSPLLRDGLRILDAGCGTGAVSIALYEALERRDLIPMRIDAFDLTEAMLEHFQRTVAKRGWTVATQRADVLNLQTLPSDWREYHLIVSASMLEYVPRERLSEALAPLRDRLARSGHIIVLITKNNWFTRPLVGRWWQSHLYTEADVLRAFRVTGFSEVTRLEFPITAKYLALWGHVIVAKK